MLNLKEYKGQPKTRKCTCLKCGHTFDHMTQYISKSNYGLDFWYDKETGNTNQDLKCPGCGIRLVSYSTGVRLQNA
jgi:DNA-directed RNA polymerase subunit M/transcription elongation factor TFIIS